MKQKTNGAGSDWLLKSLKIVPSEFGKEVANLLDLWQRGIYHLNERQLKKTDWKNPDFIEFNYRGSLSTYDSNRLTTLVLLSHDLMIRVEINAINFGVLQLRFHPRKLRDGGSIFETMPTLENHIRGIRDAFRFEQPISTNAPNKSERAASRSNNPLSLDQAVKILNAGGFVTKETGKELKTTWTIQNDDQIAAFHENSDQPVDFIRRSTAIHRARQLIRRAKPISTFAQILNEVQEPHSEFDAANETAKGEQNA